MRELCSLSSSLAEIHSSPPMFILITPDLLDCHHPFCNYHSFPTQGRFSEHLIMVFNFVCSLLDLTGNEEGKTIFCHLIRYLQYLLRLQNALQENKAEKG
jgi:hypothetical protein